MGLAEKAIEIASAKLGVKEVPAGSNRGPDVDVFLRAVHLDAAKGSYPWCAGFVCWAVQQAAAASGVSPTFRSAASVVSLRDHNQSLTLSDPEPGCIFLHFVEGPKLHGHTGFVIGVRPDGSLDTLEGNTDGAGSRTGGCVMRQHRPAGYAQAFLRIA